LRRIILLFEIEMLKACRRSETNRQIYDTCLSEVRKILMVIMHPSFLGNTHYTDMMSIGLPMSLP
jgi:hypothetical protein